jgi:hypothetical protein
MRSQICFAIISYCSIAQQLALLTNADNQLSENQRVENDGVKNQRAVVLLLDQPQPSRYFYGLGSSSAIDPQC